MSAQRDLERIEMKADRSHGRFSPQGALLPYFDLSKQPLDTKLTPGHPSQKQKLHTELFDRGVRAKRDQLRLNRSYLEHLTELVSHAAVLDQIFPKLGLDQRTTYSFASNPDLAFQQITKICDVLQLVYKQLLVLGKSQPPNIFTAMASNCRELGNIVLALQAPTVDYQVIEKNILQLTPIPGLDDYSLYYQLHQLTESNLFQTPEAVEVRLQQLTKVVNITFEAMMASVEQLTTTLVTDAVQIDSQRFFELFASIEPELVRYLQSLRPSVWIQVLKQYLAGSLSVPHLLLQVPVAERIPRLSSRLGVSVVSLIVTTMLIASCSSPEIGAEPINTPTIAVTQTSAPPPTATEQIPTPTATAKPETTEQDKRFVAIKEAIDILNQDLQNTSNQSPTGITQRLWLDTRINNTATLMFSSTPDSPGESQSVPSQIKPIGFINLDTRTLTHQQFGTVPLAALQVTPDGLTVLSPPATEEQATEGSAYVFDPGIMKWTPVGSSPEATPTPEATSAPEAAFFFETAPFTSLQEISELLGLDQMTQVMTATTPTGIKMLFYVDGEEYVPPQHRVSRIDYVNPETGLPDNDKVATYNQLAALEMQEEARAIDRDGRKQEIAPEELGQKRLTVVNLADLVPGSKVAVDAKGNLTPDLQTIIFPADDPSIEYHISIVKIVAPKDHQAGGTLELPDGTKVNLHMHSGPTGSVSYSGIFLAEMVTDKKVLITIQTNVWKDSYANPQTFMAGLIQPAWAISFGSYDEAYISKFYGVAGPEAPIVTKNVRDNRPGSDSRELFIKIVPNLQGQP